jgi:hypothetical protein
MPPTCAAFSSRRYATGGGARTILFLRTILPDRMFDRLMRRISRSFD